METRFTFAVDPVTKYPSTKLGCDLEILNNTKEFCSSGFNIFREDLNSEEVSHFTAYYIVG